jgi:UDP-N-acetylglucosamine/UDP-N-acetylgalactosamine diphosphorylase
VPALEIHAYLQELGQPHLGFGLESLSAAARCAFLEKLKSYGPQLLARQRALLAGSAAVDLSSLQPLSAVPSSDGSDRLLGERLIAEGKVGCLILAGGQGTRLGQEAPKGMVSISPIRNKSLFQLFSERAACAGRRAQRALPVAVMTSPINHAATRSYFEQHALFGLEESQLSFFSQGMLPLLDSQGNWMLAEPGILAEGPDGNGNALHSFFEQGIGAEWRKKGVEYVNVIFVDNPLADPFDSEFIGFAARSALDIGMKVVERLSTQEKMGIATRQKDKIKVVEYSEFSAESSARYSLASPGLFVFRMEFIRSLYEDRKIQLPLHLAHKTASVISAGSQEIEKKPVFKCETFQFDLLDFTDKSAAILYPRERTYAPIKNATGEKSPDAAKESLLAFDRQIYTQLSGLPAPSFAFELDPSFYYPSDALKRRMQGRQLQESGYITEV